MVASAPERGPGGRALRNIYTQRLEPRARSRRTAQAPTSTADSGADQTSAHGRR